ncbi:stomatin-like protein stl-1 [Convolutriloba macropyga]|uniref:stomatin-like protein stl-1 n=1 Tax=Convolutriloba macropyga TaxID=536237 RepID=UPI003F51FF74
MQTSRTLLNCVEIFCARSYSSSLSTMTTLCRRHATGARSLISLSCVNLTSKRLMSYRQAERRNLVIRFVPHQEAWIVERMGKFNRTLNPGIRFLLPIIDKIAYVQYLKEQVIEIAHQQAITKDNVTLTLDGVLYVRVEDPYKASYGVDDPEFAVTQLAQTSTRSELGKLVLDQVFEERHKLNLAIVDAINEASVEPWGIRCMRYEIRDIHLPDKVKETMQLLVEAERKKKAAITESEGKREAEVNVAEGVKQAQILRSEAQRMESINMAKGEAEAILSVAEARANSIRTISQALLQKDGKNAASFAIAEQYIDAFGKLAKESNTLLLPANTGDVPSMVSSALATYQIVNKQIEQSGNSSSTVLKDDSTEQKANNGWYDS